MRELSDHYEEEYLFLGDLTHDSVLISWGKFFFNDKMKLIKDKKIHMLDGQFGRHTSIGANCESYGQITVEVLNSAGQIVQSKQTERTYAWVSGLLPDTEYTYQVFVSEGGARRKWAEGPLWFYDEEAKELIETTRRYKCKFRTFPDPASKKGLVFAVLGDSGTGSDTQVRVAKALENAVAERGIRLVLMAGDTIYSKSGGSGDDDFEWLTTYFQPYRTLIDCIPFFPCMGNHDTREGFSGFFSGEKQEDRLTLYDNFLVDPRFVSELPPSREASISPGLFYRFNYGADVEFICLDTSKETEITSKRLFEFGHHKEWLNRALANPLGSPQGNPNWRIPFCHHPPYCKGPQHDEDETRLRTDVIPICEEQGIRAFIAGHEHNIQCIDSPNPDPARRVRCLISGGGGGWRDSKPSKSTDGFMQSWGGNDRGHFLLITINGKQMTIEPVDWDGKPVPLFDVQGKTVPPEPIMVLA
jgi:3',5'-cyclic AMP phosphodiesterase CpdA